MGTLHSLGGVVLDPEDRFTAHALLAAAQANDVPYDLLKSLAWELSRYDIEAEGGVMGLPVWLYGPNHVNPRDRVVAAEVAARMLRQWCTGYKGSWIHAVAAYLVHPQEVNRHPNPAEWPRAIRSQLQRIFSLAGKPIPFRPTIIAVV